MKRRPADARPAPGSNAAQPVGSAVESDIGWGFLQRSLHLLALSSLTVAQPIFDLLSRNDEFFVIRRLDRIDIAALVIGLLVAVPLPFIVIEGLLIRAPRRAQRFVHLLFIWVFTTLMGMLAVKRIEDLSATAELVLAALLGAILAILYARAKTVRAFVSMLAIALIAVPMMFVANPQVVRILRGLPASRLELPQVRTTAPIVFIVFDEFSQTVLLDADLQINRFRFPNLAELADTSTWYQNAIAAAENTANAVPAILSGLEPVAGQVPSAMDYPRNLFTAFGGSYDLWVEEIATMLCPAEINRREAIEERWLDRFGLLLSDVKIVYPHLLLPKVWSQQLPAISSAWSGFGRVDGPVPEPTDTGKGAPKGFFGRAKQAIREDRRVSLDRFVDMASEVSSSELFFLHLMLPHRPWDLLPDGRRYLVGSGHVPGLDRHGWSSDRYLADQAFQRYILQTMYVDRAVGRLVTGLKDSGRLDDTLLVLVADHGFSFTPGEHQRLVSERNANEILLVPLMIKAPHQSEGRVVGRRVSTLDVLPTVFEVLGEEPPWPMEGVSRATAAGRPQAPVRFFSKQRGIVELDPSVLKLRRRLVNAKLRLFGDGSDPDDIYRIGPFPELFGTPTKDIQILDTLNWHLQIEDADAYRDVRLESSVLPAFFRATVRLPRGAKPGHRIAIAVNGGVVATTVTYAAGGRRQGISAMLPPSALREGENEVEVFKVVRGSGGLALRPVRRD